MMNKKIWIDLDNSPHVPLFKPIIEELTSNHGYDVAVTARDCFQVPELVKRHNIKCQIIGRHYGKNKALKVAGMVFRALQMRRFAREEHPVLALSHGSRSQLLTASMLRIPSALMMDYEFIQPLPGISPNVVIMPELLADWVGQRNAFEGFSAERIRFYPGIKEDVYVPQFSPDPQFLEALGIRSQDLVVTIRPPAAEAHYHNPESDRLLDATLTYVGSQSNVRIILLPRTPRQSAQLADTWASWLNNRKMIIPEQAVDGLNLIWFSDLVISGGGTMNREAAALGVPVYSIFKGKIGAVDHYLSREGRLTLINNVDEIQKKISLRHREKGGWPKSANKLVLKHIIDHILSLTAEFQERNANSKN